MLTDPTAGAGYAFGQVLTSAHMTTIATQLPDAIDGAAGGTYTPSANVVMDNSSGGVLELGGASHWPELSPARTIERWGMRLVTVTNYNTGGGSPVVEQTTQSDFRTDSVTHRGKWVQYYTNLTNQPWIVFELETPPIGASITHIGVRLENTNSGGDASIPPKMTASHMDALTGVHSVETEVIASAYKGTVFTLEKQLLSPIAHGSGTPRRLFALVHGEAGTGAGALNHMIIGAYWKGTVPELRY